jgi:hypothetical protein
MFQPFAAKTRLGHTGSSAPLIEFYFKTAVEEIARPLAVLTLDAKPVGCIKL